MLKKYFKVSRCISALLLLLAFIAMPCLAEEPVQQQAPLPEMTPQPRVKLQTLDKATARTQTFEAKVGATLKFGSLFMKVETCYKSSPIAQPESAAFVKIWEVPPENAKQKEESEWIFSGWMFASSPALSPMDHPIYDVWLIDCLPPEGQEISPAPAIAQEPAKIESSTETLEEEAPLD